MPEREDERFCRGCLSRWLTVKYPQLEQDWEPVKRDPPDYRLRLGPRDYAVEVTRVSMPHTSVLYCAAALTREVEAEAKAIGNLSGTYVLEYSPPSADHRFRRNAMKQKALEYIAATAAYDVDMAGSQLDAQGFLHIRKVAKGGDMVEQVMSLDASRREGTVFRSTLRRVVERKRDRFRRVGVQGPAVLLLGHDYPPFEVQDYRDCAAVLAQEGVLDGWTAIFLAFGIARGDVLYSTGGFPETANDY